MKNFLLILSLFLLSTTAFAAGTGFYYDPSRDGEGIIVTIDDNDRLAFALFTFWDAKHAIPPVVSPKLELPIVPCHNCPIWYVGSGDLDKKVSFGKLYTSVALDYPNATQDGSLDEKLPVGEFTLLYSDGGWHLEVDCYDLMPPDMYMCNTIFSFDTLLIGSQ